MGTRSVRQLRRRRSTNCAPLRSSLGAANASTLYAGFHGAGLQYGPHYRSLVQPWGGQSAAEARLRARSTQEGAQVHPADLDDALCLSALIASGGASGGSQARLPFAIDDALLQGVSGEPWAVRREQDIIYSIPVYWCA